MEQENTNEDLVTESEEVRPNENGQIAISGHIKIFDPNTQEVIVDKRNAIHYENISESLANSLANKAVGQIYSMSFGNGGSSVDPTGIITTFHQIPPDKMRTCITQHILRWLMIIVRLIPIQLEIN